MPLRYRPDAYALHIQTVRQLVPGIKVSGFTCPQCGDRRQLMFCHPDAPNTWLCNKCMHFAPASHGQYQLSALARAQSALLQAAIPLEPVPRLHRTHAPHESDSALNDEAHGGEDHTAPFPDTPPGTPAGPTDVPRTVPRKRSGTETSAHPATSTAPSCTPIASKGPKSRHRRHKSL